MNIFLDPLFRLPGFEKLCAAAEKGGKIGVSGVSETSKSHILAGIAQKTGKRLCIVTANEPLAKQYHEELGAFMPMPPARLMADDVTAGDALAASYDLHAARIEALNMIHGGASAVMSAAALCCFVMPEKEFEEKTLIIEYGKTVEDISKTLVDMGYSRTPEVTGCGQFALRGGICDVFSPAAENAYRIEFFDDEVDSIRIFDVKTQLSTENAERAVIIPADADKGSAYVTDWFGDGTLFVFDEPKRLCESAADFAASVEEKLADKMLSGGDIKNYPIADFKKLESEMEKKTLLGVGALSASGGGFLPGATFDFGVKVLSSYSGDTAALADDVIYWRKTGYTIFIMAGSDARAAGIHELLEDKGLPSEILESTKAPREGTAGIYSVYIPKSFEYPSAKVVFVSGSDLFTEKRTHRRKSADAGKAIRSFDELAIGDYVVHRTHGIGRFTELVSINVGGASRDYLKIDYQGTDVLYVPVNQLNLLYKYSHAGEDTPKPKINKLGGTQWQNTKNKVRQSAKKLAIKLIELYAERSRMRGHAFSKDTSWQTEFEDEFQYEETPDQLKSIEEIKRDMEKECPMDRLLCGDVGYGKTEVAMRAAFKCVTDGFQCAYLVPTTILAQQHFGSFLKRMQSFPVKIEMLSRFRTAAQQREILKKLKSGEIDIIIGTHRLLGDDVEFKKLGLLVIDEEQRFGVAHKEKIKNLKRGIDVLTLTATPIPRTLNMAMSGIRDMSVIAMPPEDRHAIQTYVMEYSDGIAADAIGRELQRGGQVYYVYNRISGIYTKAEKLQAIFPEARIAVAHGRMNERELEDIMLKMLRGEIDVLVCTTIIETGLDIPNVNTMIVENADCMGLSQLYQLRGRVGRSDRIAYAYLMFKPDKSLSEVAEKRLVAIKEFTELGAGFKIALRDLEIRGAGDIFGPEQHGFMSTVGYDMYMRLLNEEIAELRGGEGMPQKTEAVIDLAVDAGIPESYIGDTRQRLEAYRTIADIESDEDKVRVSDELCDRYGDLPHETLMLIEVASLRVYASEAGIREIQGSGNKIVLTVDENNPPQPEGIAAVIAKYKRNILFSAGEKPYITLKNTEKNSEKIINNLKNLLKDLKISKA